MRGNRERREGREENEEKESPLTRSTAPLTQQLLRERAQEAGDRRKNDGESNSILAQPELRSRKQKPGYQIQIQIDGSNYATKEVQRTEI
jgi:hypothetical protein